MSVQRAGYVRVPVARAIATAPFERLAQHLERLVAELA